MGPARLCVAGSLNMDLTVQAPSLPHPGQTVLGSRHAWSPGGKGANQAVAAARLGADVNMIGRVGADEHGRVLRAALTACGVHLEALADDPGAPTGVGFIALAESGENTIIVSPGANHRVCAPDVDAGVAAIRAADALVLQLEIPLEANLRAAHLARERGVTVILNAAPAANELDALLELTDILVVNETEAAPVTRTPHADLAALARLPVETVVLTLGALGSRAARGGRTFDAPPFPVVAIDTVGAGDAFVGAFAARWAQQQAAGGVDDDGLRDCLTWGNAAGALAATRRGAIDSLPSRAEVIELLRAC
jgi:ribokinase